MIIRTEYQKNPLKNTYGPIWRDFNPRQTVCMGSPSPPVTKITIVDSHSILVCAENQRNHQWGCILRQHFVVFTLNHAFHSIFINTNLVRYVNYNKIVSYRVDIYQPRISILPPVKHQNGLHVEGFERIRSH